MDYRPSPDGNTIFQTCIFLTTSDIIDCFRKWLTKEGGLKSSTPSDSKMLRFWKSQW